MNSLLNFLQQHRHTLDSSVATLYNIGTKLDAAVGTQLMFMEMVDLDHNHKHVGCVCVAANKQNSNQCYIKHNY